MDESTLSPEEQKERKIMKLLLKIKNGTPPMRKVSYICRISNPRISYVPLELLLCISSHVINLPRRLVVA